MLWYSGNWKTPYDITQNASMPQLLGDFALRPSAGTLPPAHPLSAQPQTPDSLSPPPSTNFCIRHR